MCFSCFDANAQSNKNKRSSALRGALRTERTCFDVFYYNLFLKINPDKKYISGHNKIHFTTTDTTSKIQIDLYENLALSKIIFRGQPIKFVREYDAVWVYFPTQLIKNGTFFIDVYYEGKPKSADIENFQRHGFNWAQTLNGKHLVGVSCEYDGASLWYPNKDHLTDEPDSMRVHWTVPDNLQCISNGVLENITKSTKEVGYLTHNWLIKNPINNYNVTVYLGDYKEIVDEYSSVVTGKKHKISYYYYDETLEKAVDYFAFTKQFLAFFEEIYGEYPFWNDKFAVLKSNYSGMEHQSCLAIGSPLRKYNWYYTINVNYDCVLIHEIAHEWWGNSVSVGDMADVWMHEGFATYSEALFIERILGKTAYKRTIETMNAQTPLFFTLVGKKNVNVNMFENNNIYMGGASFLDKLRTKINDDKIFFDILKSFQVKFRKKIITTADFLAMVNEKTKKDFTKFFEKEVY